MWDKFHSQILIHWRATPLLVVKSYDPVKYKISLYDAPSQLLTSQSCHKTGQYLQTQVICC